MFHVKKIALYLLLLAPVAQACGWQDNWANRIVTRADKHFPLAAAKAVVTAYLGLSLAGVASLEECSSKAKLAGCSILGLLVGLTNVVDGSSSDTKQSFVKCVATSFLLVTWIAIPELLLGLLDNADASATELAK